MQRGRGGRDDFFGGYGDPFAGFPGFGGRPLISSFLGGRDPFDVPFFTQPFGGGIMGPSMMVPSMMGPSMMVPSMFGPNTFGSRGSLFGESSNTGFLEQQAPSPFGVGIMGPTMMGPSVMGPSMFGSRGSLFGESSNSGFLEQQAPSTPNKSKGPIIKEISSDDEEGSENDGNKIADGTKENSRKHYRSSKEPYVQDPNEEVEEKRSRSMHHRSELNRTGIMCPQAQTYSFQSSTVTYGGTNGAYYNASTTRRMGGDGVVMEESKEADSTTGRATHRVSRGIHDKGHTLMRKLNSDGRVDSLQTLHNLNEDELAGFDETWKGKARQHSPGWNQGYGMLDNSNNSGMSGRRDGQKQIGWALPSTAQPGNTSGGRRQPRSNSFGGRER